MQRKVAGSEQVLRSSGEIAGMGLMGLGGLIAVIGGLITSTLLTTLVLPTIYPWFAPRKVEEGKVEDAKIASPATA